MANPAPYSRRCVNPVCADFVRDVYRFPFCKSCRVAWLFGVMCMGAMTALMILVIGSW